jgi:hypothetical protein
MFRYGPVGLHHSPHVLAWLFLVLLGALVVVGILFLIRIWTLRAGERSRTRRGDRPMPWSTRR